LFASVVESSSAKSQEPSKPISSVENWVGWIESPQEHLRWIIRIANDPKTGSVSGTSSTPDRTQETIALRNIRLKAEDWGFDWLNVSTNQTLEFAGTLESPDRVTGLLLAGPQTIVIKLRKVAEIPTEVANTLGADTVWVDNVPAIAGKNKFDMRFRFYSTPPYGDENKPKILFDSLSAGLIGKPVELVSDSDSSLTFQIPSIQSEYRASYDTKSEMLLGTFSRNGTIIPLTLTKMETTKAESPTRPEVTNNKSQPDATQPMKDSAAESKDDASVKIKMQEQPTRKFASNEKAITVIVGQSANAMTRKGSDSVSKLGGTLTVPIIEEKPGSNDKKFPVIIFSSTYGPQDRDGLIGTNAHYRDLAQSLAKMGFASIRMDDRGMGSSDEPNGDFTLQDAETDLRAVIKFVQTSADLDATRIGLLGHGEGAIVATAVAATDTNVQFLILLAPPGLNGSELLLAQSDRIASLQGVRDRDQRIMREIQKSVHRISSTNQSTGAELQDAVRRLVSASWSDLQKTFPKPQSERELQELRKSLEQQLLADLIALQQPTSQQFLNTDPAKTWMLLRCPTLAIWGSNDLEVISDVNRKALQATSARNSKSNVQWLELPGLNHWFQKAKTGSTEEYETLAGVDPSLIESIEGWIADQF
jgi:hypothetical protein